MKYTQFLKENQEFHRSFFLTSRIFFTNDKRWYVAMQVIQAVNGWLFGGPVLILLFGIHVYFTIYTGVVQRKLGTGIRLSLRGTGTEKKGMSSFGTLTTTLAATLGTGNIIGVSTAVSLGGPGAVFWCWLTGVLGMATTYAETTLCCTYRETQGREPVGLSLIHISEPTRP